MVSQSKALTLACVLIAILSVVAAEVYFYESFNNDWKSRWVVSKARDNYGEWKHTTGEWFGDAEQDKGLQASQDARHYSISAKFDKVFDNTNKKTIIQYAVKMPQGIDCGGAYLKVMPEGVSQENFKDDTQYNIMFGPDICGATKRVHFIFNYNGQNLLWKKTLPCESDKLTHLYTAIVNPDNTYEVHIDGVKKESGSLFEDWDFLKPKQISDPEDKKPVDWVDQREIPDVNDVKPADWDKEPKFINDPEAKKPEDWDDEEDGEWEAPKIPNPDYKGEWSQKMIPNPEYKGEWKPRLIDNPEYVHDENLYQFKNMNSVGIEIWQVKAGTIFDDILITDDEAEAKKFADAKLALAKKEKEMFNQIEADKKAKEEEARKKAEEENEAREKQEKEKKEKEEAEKAQQNEDDELLKAAQEKAKEANVEHDEL